MTNRSNKADKVVRVILIHKSGRVNHREASNVRSLATWGKAVAHAMPDSPTPPPRVKNPAKVAAGKARAAQAAAARLAAGGMPPPKPGAKAAPAAKSPKPVVKSMATTLRKVAQKTVARPNGKASGAAMVVMAVRVTPAQKKKYDTLGPEWLRARIDAATAR